MAKTATKLEAAKAALADIEAKITGVKAKRAEQLLAGYAPMQIAKLDAELSGLQHAANTERDRAELLQEQAEKEEVERVAREKAALIKRVEAKLAERDAIAAELQAVITKADALYRDLISKSKEADAGWPFPAHDRAVVLLPAESIVTAVRNEIFRHSRPPPTGQQGAVTLPNFPGGQSPTLQLLGTPERTQPLVDRFREGTAVAVRVMREGKSTSGKPAAGPNFADGVPDFMRAEPPPRSAAQERLGQLLADQARLANDISPDGEAKYQRVVAEIATLQGEIEAARGSAAA
jgi:hypothetical protein